MNLKYRAEIDGLRALAVVPVILFHAGFELFSGGFVGVDVFFVISGYLITTILIEDIENKRFSIINFYERRARRILPALFFVMLVCIPFAWMWMLPDPLENFGQSLVATTLFSNNILLTTTEADYWAVKAIYKPLLHTWSLGVEEQYYLVFPVFLILAWRFGQNSVFWMIVVMSAGSLLMSEWGWRNSTTANFYLTPTRAWELFAGSIAAFVTQKQGVQKNNLLALIGLAAIIFSILIFDEAMPVPSLYSTVPVIGAVLLVLFANKDTFAARLLSTKVFVGIGLISYSAYLWHQPLISFFKIYSRNQVENLEPWVLVFTTICLSYLTWRFIEQPFRKGATISSSLFVALILSIALGLIAIGAYFHVSNGAPERMFSDESYKRSTHEINVAKVTRHDFRRLSGNIDKHIEFLIYGDSFAADVAYLAKYRDPSVKLALMSSDPSPQNEICRDNILSEVGRLGVKNVIFAYDEGFDISCINEILVSATKKDIDILFIGTKQFGLNLNWLSRLGIDEREALCQQPSAEKVEFDIRDEKRIPEKHYFSFFRTYSKNNCFPITNSLGELLSSDRQHFTISGVEYFSGKFFENDNVRRVFDTEN